MQQSQRMKLWQKVEPELDSIRKDIFEQQVLRIFDFTAWVEALMTNFPLSTILGLKNKQHH